MSLCAAIFRLGIVVLQCMCVGEVFYGLHVVHDRIICPVYGITHVRKCTRPSPALPYCKRWKAGRGLGTRLGKLSIATVKLQHLLDKPYNLQATKMKQKAAKS